MHIAGVDGCEAGWLCVEECEGRLAGHIFSSFADLLAALPGASVIAADIPIGRRHKASGTWTRPRAGPPPPPDPTAGSRLLQRACCTSKGASNNCVFSIWLVICWPRRGSLARARVLHTPRIYWAYCHGTFSSASGFRQYNAPLAKLFLELLQESIQESGFSSQNGESFSVSSVALLSFLARTGCLSSSFRSPISAPQPVSTPWKFRIFACRLPLRPSMPMG
jgi:hypothetical protein